MIHRYIPREIGELLVYYQWLILSFQSRIALSIFESPLSEYLFQKFSSRQSYRTRPITSDDFRKILVRETLSRLGVTIKPSQYRHIAIGLSRRFLEKTHRFEPDSDHENDSDYKDDIVDLQAGHKTRTAGLIYGRGILERSGDIFTLKKKFREASTVSLFILYIIHFFLLNDIYIYIYIYITGLYLVY